MKNELLPNLTVKVCSGSGCIYRTTSSQYYYVLTAKHVVENHENISITRQTIDIKGNLLEEELEIIGIPFLHPEINKDAALIKVMPIAHIDYFLNIDNVNDTLHDYELIGHPLARRDNGYSFRTNKIVVKNTKTHGYIEAELDNPSPHNEINGLSGGGIVKVEGEHVFLAGIQTRMAVEDHKEQLGRIEFMPLTFFDEIIDAHKEELVPLEPYYLDFFSKLKDLLNKTKLDIHGCIYFDDNYWEKLQVLDENDIFKLLYRYYAHIDSMLIPKVIANEGFTVEPEELFSVTNSEGSTDLKTISQTIEKAISESFSLIKILGEGGTGKSTFLCWIAKRNYQSYSILFVERLYHNAVESILNFVSELMGFSSKPIIFLIDDIAEDEKIRETVDLINILKEKMDNSCQIVFVIAERKSRYNSQRGSKKIDIKFSGSVQLLNYAPVSKEKVFSKIYSVLSKGNMQLNDATMESAASDVFINNNVNSISESIFGLLNFLKLRNGIDYDFDWIDWNEFAKKQHNHQSLENLFIAVVCFYQFGIKLPITFKCSCLTGLNRVEIMKAITDFGIDDSPIKISESTTDYDSMLFLKHEYVANWFLHDERRKKVVIEFFKDFLASINSEEAGWLLRKIRKAQMTEEFMDSGFSELLNGSKYIELIDSYIALPHISELEKIKMSMEKGIYFTRNRKENLAKPIFLSIIDKDPSNNHARDQLAKIYLKSSSDYQLAFDQYLAILTNGAIYPIIQINKLLRFCKKNNIHIVYEKRSNILDVDISDIIGELSTFEYYELIKELILNWELDLAEHLLNNIESWLNITADCYNLLAHSFVFSSDFIERKERYFKKAIEIDKSINPNKPNFKFTITYAVFLYRIRRFPESLSLIKSLISYSGKEYKELIELKYWTTVRNTNKLFFNDIPSKNDLDKFKIYLFDSCIQASALVSIKQENIDNIIKGYLILQTVKYHSKVILLEVFNNASKLVAYCYAMNAEKMWNNLSVRENRIIGEKIYDQLIDVGYRLDTTDCTCMIKNLLNFKEKEKSSKAFNLVNSILEDKSNRKYPIFYRYRGNARKYFEDYNKAMVDYQTALNLSIPENFKNYKSYKKDRCYLLNNLALLICDCIEAGKPLNRYGLKEALLYCNESIRLWPNKQVFKATKERVEKLM